MLPSLAFTSHLTLPVCELSLNLCSSPDIAEILCNPWPSVSVSHVLLHCKDFEKSSQWAKFRAKLGNHHFLRDRKPTIVRVAVNLIPYTQDTLKIGHISFLSPQPKSSHRKSLLDIQCIYTILFSRAHTTTHPKSLVQFKACLAENVATAHFLSSILIMTLCTLTECHSLLRSSSLLC